MRACRKQTQVTFWSLFLTVALLLPTTSHAQSFGQGSTNISVLLASGRAFSQNYTVVGVGAGYFVTNGLELGLEVEAWLSGDPNIYKVTPNLRYVFNVGGQIKPYVGAFYRRVYIQGYPDLDSWGGRAGAFIAAGTNSYVGVGVVYSELRDCNTQIYQTCSDTYPEFTLGFTI